MAITPTATEISRLRRQLGLDSTQLPDVEIEELYTEADTAYPVGTYGREVIFAAARLQAAKDMMAEAAQRVTYAQGQSRENLSDLLKNMKALIAEYTSGLQELLDAGGFSLPPVRWGRTKTIPSVSLENPDG